MAGNFIYILALAMQVNESQNFKKKEDTCEKHSLISKSLIGFQKK